MKHPETSALESFAEDRHVGWFVNYPKKVRPATQNAMNNLIGDIGVIKVTEASRTANIGAIVRFTITLPADMSFEEADELENEMDQIAMRRHS